MRSNYRGVTLLSLPGKPHASMLERDSIADFHILPSVQQVMFQQKSVCALQEKISSFFVYTLLFNSHLFYMWVLYLTFSLNFYILIFLCSTYIRDPPHLNSLYIQAHTQHDLGSGDAIKLRPCSCSCKLSQEHSTNIVIMVSSLHRALLHESNNCVVFTWVLPYMRYCLNHTVTTLLLCMQM